MPPQEPWRLPVPWMLHIAFPLLVVELAGLVALLVLCLYLFKAYRVTSSRLFAYFFLGFTVLGAGEIARSILLLAAALSRARLLIEFFLIHVAGGLPQLCETIALILIALGYAREITGKASELAFIIPGAGKEIIIQILPRDLRGPLFFAASAVNMVLLTFITISSFAVYSHSRKDVALLPAVAFLLMLLSNMILIPSLLMLNELLFLLSKLFHLAGLLSLLALTFKVIGTQ
ncbi:MAG: hypothetical protein QW291_07905 [Thermofilaceae archaeon]